MTIVFVKFFWSDSQSTCRDCFCSYTHMIANNKKLRKIKQEWQGWFYVWWTGNLWAFLLNELSACIHFKCLRPVIQHTRVEYESKLAEMCLWEIQLEIQQNTVWVRASSPYFNNHQSVYTPHWERRADRQAQTVRNKTERQEDKGRWETSGRKEWDTKKKKLVRNRKCVMEW